MALSMDEERMLAEIERRLADDDPVLAARLTSFRLPRLSFAPRSSRGRLTASLLMLMVVAAVSVFVYAMMPFRGQVPGSAAPRASTASISGKTGSATLRPAPSPRSSPTNPAGSGPVRPGSTPEGVAGDFGT
jgi:hypothetical protein